LGWPYITFEPIYKYYYLISMGFHISQLVSQLALEDWSRSDFVEMTLHHAVTVYLFGFSYIGNLMIGGPVTFLHNWADVTISWTRMWGETRFYKTLGVYSFILAQGVWAYTRLYVFAQLILSFQSFEVFMFSQYIQGTFVLLLSCLYILHVYWFLLMLRMTYRSLIGSQYEDTVNLIKKASTA
jgi:acyl-CoA-dependent ceramide synthase